MRLRISDDADRDFENILAHGLRTYGERPAYAFLAALRTEIGYIAEWPLAAELLDEIDPPVRRRVYGPYIFTGSATMRS
jgi:plasmid stabilization system protein ParE